ncbi:MAG: hypothetical protein ABIM30_00370 [candidate division WOR-3 bacterium]
MDKIAFFYKLGYNMTKEAASLDELMTATEMAKAYDLSGKEVANLIDMKDKMDYLQSAYGKDRGPSLWAKLVRGTKATGMDVVDIYKSLLGIGRKGVPYLKNVKNVLGRTGVPSKAIAAALPLVLAGGGGYGAYRATRKKSPKEKLLKALGLD